MNGWIKLAALLAAAAVVAGLSGGAGAASSTSAGILKAGSRASAPNTGTSLGTARGTVLRHASRTAPTGSATRGAGLLRHANLRTTAGVKGYLRAIGVDPSGVVVQRGGRNYAGPTCPGAGWKCTSTAHPVVQIGGTNTFLCTTGSCVVVQAATRPSAANAKRSLAAATAVTNTAKCIRTTGLTQSCSISQSSATANNVAIVVEIANKTSGLTQDGSSTAQISQQATGGSNTNTACVYQTVSIDGSTVAKGGSPVTVTLNAHQSVSIVQDSHGGGNTAQAATAAGNCDASNPLNQTQALTSSATGSGPVTQNENATDNGPNMTLDIEQNQSPGFLGSASGANNAKFAQTNTLTAVASTPVGPVAQTQSSPNGGIQAKVNQFSHDVSTAIAKQTETQCEHAQKSGPLTCNTPQPPSYSLTQVQFGPIRKGGDSSTQADNANDVFTIDQSSKQNNDTGQNQTNTVQGDCTTSGNCAATQTTNVDGQTTTNTRSGQNVSTSINCTGTTCTTPTITFDGSPGTNAPPATLGPYSMTAFGPDPQPLNDGTVTGVSDPAGMIGFSPALNHSTVGNGWATWSHGYTGDVYWIDTGSTITITLPAGTTAFYLYAEPNTRAPFNVQATAQDGTTSGPVLVDGNGGAQYFGFYGTGGATLASITVTTADTSGLGVGEFGIAPSATPIP